MLTNKRQPNANQFKLATFGALLLLSACTTNTKPMDAAKANSTDQAAAPREQWAEGDFPGWHNPMLAHAAKYAGQALIANLKSAQTALDLNDLNQASQYLDAASDLANGIRTMMPFTVMLDQIKDAKGIISVNADLFETDTLLPIYQSLEELDVYAPEAARQSRDKVSQAEKLAKTGKNTQAVEMLDQVEADIADTTVYMPVLTVSQRIENAMLAMRTKPFNKVTVQEQIDMALTSMIDDTRGTAIVKAARYQ
ncbi:MAG: YfdX family protein [Methylomonas sp.]|jgi:subtilisin family serine protease|uniref:YfdX family protein n=1 Tax=Methylomonas sp. TaxID=418 RepID=UPI0025CC5104|nr:YfdX family protein [Methylomonas sp.]MCK9609036.1 YfdX family protein [Methylomonas sp.]